MDTQGEEPREPRILFEDPSLVAVLKPPRMHSAPGLGKGDLCAWVFERYPDAGAAGYRGRGTLRSPAEGGLLHRLDFETSGIVLFARNSEAFAAILGQQEEGGFVKEYVAYSSVSSADNPAGSLPGRGVPKGVDEGPWSEARERLDADRLSALLGGEGAGEPRALSCSFRPFGPKGARVACLGLAKEAKEEPRSIYRSDILAVSVAEGSAVRLRVRLSRGFRHQVRAQLAWVGLPIRGDSLYGGLPDERLRLYAASLAFTHPLTGEALFLEAEA